ncbi:MAG: hypothetical protein FJY67_03790 [Calditrichaeota bacterium]|nr:hypothetical protein [Calditrichota bacterium]
MQRQRSTGFFTSLLVLAIVGIRPAPAATSAAAFLKIPSGARELAIGETGVSHASTGAAAWWNPALIAFGEREVRFQGFRWLADSRGTLGAVKFRTPSGGLSASYFNLATPGFEARTRPGDPEGEFTLHQAYLSLAGAYLIRPDLAAGAAIKGWVEDIYGDKATGFPVADVGFTWQPGLWKSGLSVSNFGRPVGGFDLPLTLRAGAARSHSFGDFGLLIASELSVVLEDPAQFHFGIEADYSKVLYLRTGWFGNRDISRTIYGIGLAQSIYRIDASLAPFEGGLGSGWRIGIGVRL